MSFLDELLDERTASTWIEQNSPEWDAIRLGRFTSSEMYRLMTAGKREMTEAEKAARPKKGPGSRTEYVQDYTKLSDAAFTYINEKVAEILTGSAKTTGYAFPLVWGTEHEAEAVEFFEKKTGLVTEKCGFFTYTDHAGGSPDRLVGDDAILEAKCPADSVNQIDYLMLIDHYGVKENYFQYWVQCQANMLFTERKLCHFITFDPRMKLDKHKLQHIEIPADTAFQDLIIAQITKAVKEKLEMIARLK